MTIKEWQKEVHQGARDRGFYDGELGEKTPVRISSMLALIHSEVSEALEDVRKENMQTTFRRTRLYSTTLITDFDKIPVSPLKPEGFPSELADIIIRTLDVAEWLGIDMEKEIKLKNDYNKTREHRHGGKSL